MLQKVLSSWATIRLSTRISAPWSYIRRHSEVHMPLLESSVHLPQTHASPLHKNTTCGCWSVCPITGMYFFCPLHYSISVAQALSCNVYKNSSSLSSSHKFRLFSEALFVYTPALLLSVLYFLFLAHKFSFCGWPILSIITQMGAPSNFVVWNRNTAVFHVYFGLQSSFYSFLVSWGGARLSSLGRSATNWTFVPAPDDRWWWWWWMWSNLWNESWQGKQKYLKKTCHSVTLSTTNPTWPDLSSNTGRRDGKPATNWLSYGTAEFGLKGSHTY
jgi:hypothetical protein